MAEFVYNNHHHPLINTTPFFANYGYHLTLMNILMIGQSGPSDKHVWQIHEVQAECKQVIKWSQEISKTAYDRWKRENPGFEVGNCVWLEATNLVMDEPSPKLTSKWHGPFPIKDKLLELMYQLKLPAHWKTHNVFHVNLLSEAKPDMIPHHQNLPLPPIKVNNKDYWVMEKCVDACWF